MNKLSVSWTIKKIVQNIDKGKILFNHLMQRKSNQWSEEQKSLLIHSLVSDYPIPPLYAIQDDTDSSKYSVLDGKQRLINISEYIKNNWSLTEDTPNVLIDGKEYKIAGQFYKELNENVKDELKDASLLMYIFEDCSEDEIEEIFYRLNNGTALTKDQKTRAKLGSNLIKFIDQILELDFFKKKAYFTKYQLRKAEDQTCVLQTLMLYK